MDWSKVRQRAESRFSRSLQGRLSVHATRYRKSSHDQLYELWFAFDGEKLCSISDGEFYEAAYDRKTGQSANWHEIERSTPSGLTGKRLVQESLDLGIDALLEHSSPIVRALGIVDARFGERRLRQLDITAVHPIIARLAQLRAHIDGVNLAGQSRSSETPQTA